MALTLQRRHSADCEGGHTPRSRTYEHDERKKGWKRCFCPIYASGTLSDGFKRRDTGKVFWDEAKPVADAWSLAGSWNSCGSIPIAALPPAPSSTAPDRPRTAIGDATDAYLANRRSREIASSTLRKYQTLVRQLRAFAEKKGYVMLDQFTVPDMDEFYGTWNDGLRAKGKKLERLKGFFKFCVTRKLTDENVAQHLEPPVGAGSAANKWPFSDEEIERQLEACKRLGTVNWKNGKTTGSWSGDEVATFILLECYTGLRISDAATFSIDRLQGNDCFIRMHKTDGPLFTWLPDEIVERLNALAKKNGSKPFMVTGGSEEIATVADLWRRKLNKVWQLCGTWERPPHPHRFRHTFVRILLERGVRVGDVAELIGDDEATVRKHYSRWVPERQKRLTKILREALEPRKAKLIAIAGGKAG